MKIIPSVAGLNFVILLFRVALVLSADADM